MRNPWQVMTIEDGRAMDRRKEEGPLRLRTAVTREVLWRMIRNHLPEDRDRAVLDVGGGTGYWTLRLAKEGYAVALADISPGLLACAREKIEAAGLAARISIEEADVCDLSRFDDAAFPVVLALGDVLSYCGDSGRALREIRRVTADGGVLIGDVENRYRAALFPRRARSWEQARAILMEGEARWPDPENRAPIREFTPADLKELLKAAGWTLVAMYPSDAVASSVSSEIFEEALRSEAGLADVVALEERLREDPSLLGAGSDLQFVARKGPVSSERCA